MRLFNPNEWYTYTDLLQQIALYAIRMDLFRFNDDVHYLSTDHIMLKYKGSNENLRIDELTVYLEKSQGTTGHIKIQDNSFKKLEWCFYSLDDGSIEFEQI